MNREEKIQLIVKKLNSLGFEIKKSFEKLFLMAFTHVSLPDDRERFDFKDRDYERLEFLGDSVLSFVVTTYLFDQDLSPSEMHSLRSELVCKYTLRKIGVELGFLELIVMDSAISSEGRLRIVGDVVESVIGALYLEGGVEKAKKFITWIPTV